MKLPKFIDDNLIILSAIGVGVVLLVMMRKKQKSEYDKDCGCTDKILYKDMEEGDFKRLSKEKGFGCLHKEPKTQSDCKPGCKFVMGSSSDCSGCPPDAECICQMVFTPNSCVKDENY